MLSRHKRRMVAGLACIAVMWLGQSAAPAAATTPPSPDSPDGPSVDPLTGEITLPPTGRWAPYPEGTVGPTGESPPITAGRCTYLQANDNPHRTGNPIDVSVHGWWRRAGGTCPSKNHVTVGLQAFWCDLTCYWVTVDTGEGDYFQGPGSGKWANARRRCAPATRVVGWRAWTDVDLIGIRDPSGEHYTLAQNYYCTPG